MPPKSKSLLVPAALKRDASSLTETERESAVVAVERFVEELGGRSALIETLELAAAEPEVDLILSLLGDPRYEKWTLRRLCSQAGLTIQEFFLAFQKATLVRAKIAATREIASGLVPVVRDVMKRAAPYEEVCDTCSGTGTFTPEPSRKVPNPSPEPCKTCHARGKLIIVPELDRQKLALELGDLVKKGGGFQIQNNQLNLAGSAGGTAAGDLEKLQQALAGGGFAVDPPPAGPDFVVEADILPAAPDPAVPPV